MIPASIAIQVLPSVPGNQVIPVVDKVIDYIKSTGLNMFVSPFETTIEGELDELLDVVKRCQYICIEAGAPSLMSYVKINYNPTSGVFTIDEKVPSNRN